MIGEKAGIRNQKVRDQRSVGATPQLTATNGQYPIVIFYGAELDIVFVVVHNEGPYQCFSTKTGVLRARLRAIFNA